MAPLTSYPSGHTAYRWYGLLVLSLICGIYIGTQINAVQTKINTTLSPSGAVVTERHLGRMTFTNPLIDIGATGSTNELLQQTKDAVAVAVTDLVKKEAITTLSVYYQDLETGNWFGVNEREQYIPASLMKVTLMTSYFKLAEYTPGLLERTIVYDGRHAEKANLPPAQRLALGKTYTIESLIEQLIIHSDNEARAILADYLTERVDEETHARLIRDSMTLIPADYELGDEYQVTPIDYAGVFRILYNATYLSETMSERALHLLSLSSYDSGIVNGLPADIITANKFGFNDNPNYVDGLQLHDCGIVYTEPNPYVICIMTKTTNVPAAQEAIASISELIYSHLYDE